MLDVTLGGVVWNLIYFLVCTHHLLFQPPSVPLVAGNPGGNLLALANIKRAFRKQRMRRPKPVSAVT